MIIIVFFTTTLNEFLPIMFFQEVQVLKYACRTVQAEPGKDTENFFFEKKIIKCTLEYQHSKEYFPM